MITIRFHAKSTFSVTDSGRNETWGGLTWEQVLAYFVFVGPHYDDVQVMDANKTRAFERTKELKQLYGEAGMCVTAVIAAT